MKSPKWEFYEAKNNFAEVTRKAITEGPQSIAEDGKDRVVVLSAEDYRNLAHRTIVLANFLHHTPLAAVDITRDKMLPRDLGL